MESARRLVLAISPFAIGPEYFHSLHDDQFYFGYLVERGREFLFFAPQLSCDHLEKSFPAHRHRLRVLSEGSGMRSLWRLVDAINVSPASSVVFFGYSEKLVAVFLLRHAFTDFRLTLVATNNFSSRRVRLYGLRLRAFLRLARLKLQHLVVHTDFELMLVERLNRAIRLRAMSKRHHLMLPKEVTSFVSDRPVIAFFGPVKPEKPIEPLATLIAADVRGRLEFRVYGVSEVEGQILRSRASPQGRVLVHSGWMSNEAYSKAVTSANVVLLTHNSDFQGKLSGNLCDCIAYQVPFIGSTIEPHMEYLRRFGHIGYTVDMTNERWANDFLQSFAQGDLQLRRERMQSAAASFTREAIYEDLDRCIS